MHYPPSRNLAHYDGGVVVDPNVYADNMALGKLHNRVIRHDREDKDRLAVLNFNDGESDPTFGEPLVVEVEDQPVLLPLDNHF